MRTVLDEKDRIVDSVTQLKQQVKVRGLFSCIIIIEHKIMFNLQHWKTTDKK